MKTSTAILLVGAAGIGVWFLLRPSSSTQRQSAPAQKPSQGGSAITEVATGLFAVGVSALGNYFSHNSANTPAASSTEDTASLDAYAGMSSALSLNGLFGD